MLPAQQTRSASTPLPIDRRADDKLRAASEPFEKLTEIAFTATALVIDRTIREAATAARDVRPWLSSSAATRLEAQIAAVKSARRKRDHAGLALASIEAYRVLVDAVGNDARIPTEVSLLDYADLKADPARWADMAEAVSFARENWAKLLPKVTSFPQLIAFEKVIVDMAVDQKNASAAALSVKAELDLVDQLEAFFSTH